MINSTQRAYLKKLAHDLDSVFQVGKLEVTPEIVIGVSESLEKRELIKIAVLNNCMMDTREVADIISERTRSDIVQIIGKKIVLYRKSKTKPAIQLPK